MRSCQSGCGRRDALPGADQEVEALLRLQPPGGDDDLRVERRDPAAHARDGVGDALDPDAAPASAARVVALVGRGQDGEGVEAAVAARRSAASRGRCEWKFMCSWPIVIDAGRGEPRGEQVERRAGRDQDAAADARGSRAAGAGRSAGSRTGTRSPPGGRARSGSAVEQAAVALVVDRRSPRAGAGTGRTARSRRRIMLSSSTSPPRPSARLKLVRTVPPRPYACSRRMRTRWGPARCAPPRGARRRARAPAGGRATARPPSSRRRRDSAPGTRRRGRAARRADRPAPRGCPRPCRTAAARARRRRPRGRRRRRACRAGRRGASRPAGSPSRRSHTPGRASRASSSRALNRPPPQRLGVGRDLGAVAAVAGDERRCREPSAPTASPSITARRPRPARASPRRAAAAAPPRSRSSPASPPRACTRISPAGRRARRPRT